MTTIGTTISASTALQTDVHNDIRDAVMAAYRHPFNKGKEPDPFLIEAIVHGVGEYISEQEDLDGGDPQIQAFEAVATERVYQDAGFGNAADTLTGRGPGRPMTPGECLLTMRKILDDAIDTWYRPQSGRSVQDLIRKIGGVAVQALERYGAPKREFTPEQQRILQAREASAQIKAEILGAMGAMGAGGARGL